MREGDAAVGGLALVKRRLQAELDSNQASPSQRLLNTMLDVMQPEPGLTLEEQEEVSIACPNITFNALFSDMPLKHLCLVSAADRSSHFYAPILCLLCLQSLSALCSNQSASCAFADY